MKRWTLALFGMVMMLGAEQVLAQGFQVYIGHLPPQSPLVTACGGATPLPDGTIVKIFYDADDDGPDATDAQPPVCLTPPECPYGTCSFNQFAMNGGTWPEVGPGFFYTEGAFSYDANTPSPSGFYLRIYEADNVTTLWTSTVFHVLPGYNEWNLQTADWTCGPTGQQCQVIDEAE